MSWNPIGDIKKAVSKAEHAVGDLGKKAIHDVEGIANKAKHEVEGVANNAKHEVEGLANTAKHEIQKVEQEAKHGVETAGHEVVKTFEERIPTLVEDAIDQALKAVASGALNKAVDIIQIAAPDEFDLKVGPVGLSIGDVKTRIDTLQRWATDPPTDKSHIREMIETLAPTSVSVEIAFSVALVLVQSDSLECGVTMSWETSSFLEKFEDILGAF